MEWVSFQRSGKKGLNLVGMMTVYLINLVISCSPFGAESYLDEAVLIGDYFEFYCVNKSMGYSTNKHSLTCC